MRSHYFTLVPYFQQLKYQHTLPISEVAAEVATPNVDF
jgi:hypothetical protein